MKIEPAASLRGHIAVPGDKSISHRAVLLGAIGEGETSVRGFGRSGDTEATIAAVRALGVTVDEDDVDSLRIQGAGLRGLREPSVPIDCGNSGTTLRLLAGILAGQPGRFELTGDESLRRRPVDRIAEPLAQMGATVESDDGTPPLVVAGGELRGIRYELPVASAQVKSCLLLAALAADGATTVGEPAHSRDHTERMLLRAGVGIHRNGRHVTVVNTDELLPHSIAVPGDVSSAAFMITAGVLVPGSRLLLAGVGVNWTRTGFLRILRRMRGIVLGDLEEEIGELIEEEPVSDLDVAHGALEATIVEPEEVPMTIDELPLVALLGCFAEGETIVRGAQELRVKESDRIATVVNGLRGLGAEIEATPDGFVVTGSGGLRGGVIDSHGDHRLAMMGAIAGMASQEGVEVLGMDAAAVSYPRFMDDFAALA
jgi:3-phosphoshikimate 1-carboxyvinyltransferase